MTVGSKVKIISDNENYEEYLNKVLIITDEATNQDQHPGYDNCMGGEPLFDLRTEDGEEIPFSLYQYELTWA